MISYLMISYFLMHCAYKHKGRLHAQPPLDPKGANVPLDRSSARKYDTAPRLTPYADLLRATGITYKEGGKTFGGLFTCSWRRNL